MRIFLATASLIIFQFSFAQTAKDSLAKTEAYVGFSAGYGLQTDDARLNINQADSIGYLGPRLSGFNLQLALDLPVGKRWGLAFKLRSQRYKMDDELLLFQFRKRLPEYDWNMVSSSFKLNSFLLGGMYSFPTGAHKRLNTNLKLMGGFGNITSPRVSVEGHNKDSTVWVFSSQLSTRTITFLTGIGVRYDLTDVIALSFDMDYQYTSFKMQDGSFNSNFSGNNFVHPNVKDIPKFTYAQYFNTINILVGIGFNLR